MPRPDVLVLVLAGGAGSRLELLTERRAKPAVPFAGSYRLIDFPLSNCLHSNIPDVWVLQQYQPASLNDHLANGRPWDLDRTSGGLMVLPPYEGSGREGFTQGTADGLWRNAELIRQLNPRSLVVVSADAVYRLDYRQVVQAHRSSDALVTMVTTEVDRADAGRYGVVEVSGGRVTEYVYKPDEPNGNVVSNEVFVMTPEPVLALLDEIAERNGSDELADLGTELLPRLVESGDAAAFAFDGYWRDVGTIDAYWSVQLDFLDDDPPIDLDDPQWPIRTQGGRRSPAWLASSASVTGSLVSAGSHVAGEVRRSVLSPGVRVEQGATVVDSILLPGAVVRSGASVQRAVVDDNVVIGRDARVGDASAVTLLGRETEIEPGAHLPGGARRPDPESD
jgi:glucose-1-phosphate adenylyltransferase